MTHPASRPTLTLFRRADCQLCDEGRDALQVALEERARLGEPLPAVTSVDIDADPTLIARYGDLIPVMAIGGDELHLATSGRRIRLFLDRALGRLA